LVFLHIIFFVWHFTPCRKLIVGNRLGLSVGSVEKGMRLVLGLVVMADIGDQVVLLGRTGVFVGSLLCCAIGSHVGSSIGFAVGMIFNDSGRG